MDLEGIFFNTKDYELSDKEIGKGAFGTVYIATNKKNQKFLEDGFDGYEQKILLRESLILHKINHPRVCDFGLSKCISGSLSKSSKLTITGQIGTQLYMAPELLRGEDSDGPEVDVLAFTILAYEIVTGEALYSELGNVSSFVLANKVMSGYRPKLCSNILKKM